MVGLDQDMMQKNLTCKTLKEAQKNMLTFSIIFVVVVGMFLLLGVLLYLFALGNGIALPQKSDFLFPMLALHHMNLMIGVFFLLGITAANYASADSALTSLTTAFCVDFFRYPKTAAEHAANPFTPNPYWVFTTAVSGYYALQAHQRSKRRYSSFQGCRLHLRAITWPVFVRFAHKKGG